MRKVIIDNRELLKILQDKEKVQSEIDKKTEEFKNLTAKSDDLKEQIEKLKLEFKEEHDKINGEVIRIDEEMQPYLNKIQRFKDKIMPFIEKQSIKLGEFEVLNSVEIDSGKATCVIVDKVELFKEQLRTQNQPNGVKENNNIKGDDRGEKKA